MISRALAGFDALEGCGLGRTDVIIGLGFVPALITAETRRLHIAAHRADLHPGDAVVASRLPGTEHPVQLGGDGTPTVGDFAPAELGCVLRMSDGSACRLMGDGLDLRHRISPPSRLHQWMPSCPVVGGGVVGTATNPAGGRH
jgi:hypothetical protein